jgi:hypothetical protein
MYLIATITVPGERVQIFSVGMERRASTILPTSVHSATARPQLLQPIGDAGNVGQCLSPYFNNTAPAYVIKKKRKKTECVYTWKINIE